MSAVRAYPIRRKTVGQPERSHVPPKQSCCSTPFAIASVNVFCAAFSSPSLVVERVLYLIGLFFDRASGDCGLSVVNPPDEGWTGEAVVLERERRSVDRR